MTGMLSLLALIVLSPRSKFGAWVLLDDGGKSAARFESHVECFDSVSAQFYSCTKDGLIEHAAGIPEHTFKAVSYTHLTLPTIYSV